VLLNTVSGVALILLVRSVTNWMTTGASNTVTARA